MKAALACAALALGVAASPLDNFADREMARHVLGQIPLLVVLGTAAGYSRRHALARCVDDHGLCGLFAVAGALAFWLLPRSLDACVGSDLVDQLMHATMFSTGAMFGVGLQRLPFAARGAAGILLVAMLFSVGTCYARSVVLVCSAYTLDQQHAAGRAMVVAGVVVLLLLLGALARQLVFESRAAERPSPEAAS